MFFRHYVTKKCLVFQGFQKKEAFIAAQGKQIISIYHIAEMPTIAIFAESNRFSRPIFAL